MKYIKRLFESLTEEQVSLLKEKLNELKNKYLESDEARTSEELMYDVFDLTHTVKPNLDIYWTEKDENTDQWLSVSNGFSKSLDLDFDPDRLSAFATEQVDDKLVSLSRKKRAELQISYNFTSTHDNFVYSYEFTEPEDLVEILERVRGVNEIGGLAVVGLYSNFRRPVKSSHVVTPKHISLRSDNFNMIGGDYDKWIKFIGKLDKNLLSSIKLVYINLLFKVDVDMEFEDYEAVLPSSVLTDFKQFCDEYKLGSVPRKKLADIFAKTKDKE